MMSGGAGSAGAGSGTLSTTAQYEKYDRLAEGFSEREYADPEVYSARRAQLFLELGPRLDPGATVVDLGCGDGIMAGPLTGLGLHYIGVDSSEQMVEAARRRHPGVEFVAVAQEEYEPREPVDATLCLRAFYYPEDRVAFFPKVAGYTKVKFVFDFRQAEHSAESVLARRAGGGLLEDRAAAVLHAATAGAAAGRALRARPARANGAAGAVALQALRPRVLQRLGLIDTSPPGGVRRGLRLRRARPRHVARRAARTAPGRRRPVHDRGRARRFPRAAGLAHER